MNQRFQILYPERRTVSGQTLITWARDDVANGISEIFQNPDEVLTVDDALTVLNDSGSVTVAAYKVDE